MEYTLRTIAGILSSILLISFSIAFWGTSCEATQWSDCTIGHGWCSWFALMVVVGGGLLYYFGHRLEERDLDSYE